MAVLSIPKRQYGVLKKISELTDDQFNDLLIGLNSVESSISPLHLAKGLSEKTKAISSADIKYFVAMLCGLYSAKENNKKTAVEIAHDIRETVEEEKPASFPPDKIQSFESRMVKLLTVDKAIAVTAKAHDIVTNHANIFCGVKVLSDIRPIFSASADVVSAAVVVHALNISYHQAQEHKEFFVALDNADVSSLRAALERAEKKAKILASMIQKAGINYLEEGE